MAASCLLARKAEAMRQLVAGRRYGANGGLRRGRLGRNGEDRAIDVLITMHPVYRRLARVVVVLAVFIMRGRSLAKT